jgi:hypothetical protein
MTVSQQLRQAIVDSEMTHYAIGKQSGVAINIIGRIVAETADVRVSTVDRLCEYFGLELRPIKGAAAAKQASTSKRTRAARRQS